MASWPGPRGKVDADNWHRWKPGLGEWHSVTCSNNRWEFVSRVSGVWIPSPVMTLGSNEDNGRHRTCRSVWLRRHDTEHLTSVNSLHVCFRPFPLSVVKASFSLLKTNLKFSFWHFFLLHLTQLLHLAMKCPDCPHSSARYPGWYYVTIKEFN